MCHHTVTLLRGKRSPRSYHLLLTFIVILDATGNGEIGVCLVGNWFHWSKSPTNSFAKSTPTIIVYPLLCFIIVHFVLSYTALWLWLVENGTAEKSGFSRWNCWLDRRVNLAPGPDCSVDSYIPSGPGLWVVSVEDGDPCKRVSWWNWWHDSFLHFANPRQISGKVKESGGFDRWLCSGCGLTWVSPVSPAVEPGRSDSDRFQCGIGLIWIYCPFFGQSGS